MTGPRYSIIPGDFAADVRADVAHFRVLNLIGRHTDENGWCRLKQITIGATVGLTRETVNRKLKDLVAWGYVEKRASDATGRAIYYRTIMDRGGVPALCDGDFDGEDAAADAAMRETQDPDGPVSGGSHVGYNPDAELHPTCDPIDHTRCDRTQSHQNDPSLTKVRTPTPQAGRSEDLDFELEAERQTAQVKAKTALAKVRLRLPLAPAIDAVLVPLLAQRRFSAADHAAAFLEIIDRAAGLPEEHLAKVLDLVLAAGVQTVKPQRVLDAIEAVRKGGLMLVVANGSAEFAAWQRHLEHKTPSLAALMARSPKWQVPSPWPPKDAAP